eukprot:CAMPEP_0183326608 /NCGR_PEP_ID=MMETSP0160_2-20130417/82663_1 /TAXON_ID=2839 ORGANISM="Odontella Sinensis, Strain Grunow 1884" /NCGR_SAMPLE_ID=MMETSP0160_2 /ASSEMBLY_ACC=CAM_ASM_000250 /LENGTH=402 /DNA_ID=CAMNT_0025494631 /DNA_START=121 /DNA_END=1329 /DNA_ORIENTATION=-
MMETSRNDIEPSDLPALGYPELVLGRVVGRGGFSAVNEVANINLQEVFETSNEASKRRAELAACCHNNETGSNRYVVKMLRTDLPEDEHTKGVVDLAVEARFLAMLSHPNIITMRATANSDPLESKFFVLLDKLATTLEYKMQSWRKEIGAAMGFWFGPCIGHCCANKQILHKLWIDRLLVARDVSAAIRYLHDQDIVYRDLKPDNVGFSEEGEVKIFDFGLAKRLHPDDRVENGLYMLTGNTGSLRYMAPEVALGKPYNERVDAYSFGILFWQICALTTPYSGYSCKMHSDLVVGKGYRPKADSSWPAPWTELMKRSWSSDVYTRPDFEHIVGVLDEEIEEMLREDELSMPNKRSGHIHARKKKSFRIKARKDRERLDVDTRITGFVAEDGPQKRHDVDVV